MSDGTVLLADHYLPAGDDRAPLVLIRTPYGRRGPLSWFATVLAHEGFQVVQQSCRGTGGSGGAFTEPFRQEAQDGSDTVAWLRGQPFYPGTFATFGGSYLGYTQLALPPDAKRDLFAAVLQEAPTSTRDLAWPGGALCLTMPLGWSAQVARNPAAFYQNLLRGRSDLARIHAAGGRAPLLTSYRRVTGRQVEHLDRWLQAEDEYLDAEDMGSGLDTYDCPVLVQGGWYDVFCEASIRQYERLKRAGTPVSLTMGPWTHTSFAVAGDVVLAEAVNFLRAASGMEDPPPLPAVRLLDVRSGLRAPVTAWPADTEPVEQHLAASGTLTVDASGPGGQTGFTYDPSHPTPHLGGALLENGGGSVDNALLEQRNDVLTWTSQPLEAPVLIVGAPAVDLWLSADVPAPGLFVRLNVVDTRGVSRNVTDTALTASVPGDGSPAFTVVHLRPVCLRVESGERLRLLVTGGAFPQYARTPGTGQSPATATEFLTAHVAVHFGRDHPSRLSLPCIPPGGHAGS
jgi:putative CocE/NonD family hydrolase